VPTVTKSVSSTTQNPDGTWTIRYQVGVHNAPNAAPTRYTLTDTLAFGSGITTNSARVDGPADETLNPNWNGSTDITVVTDGALKAGQTDEYTITVNATVAADATAGDRACSSGGGFGNTAEVGLAPAPTAAVAAATTDPTAGQIASACADPVSPTIVKKAVGAAQHPGDETWDVTYTLSVTNPSTTTGLVYTLTDTPSFPAGVTVNTATVTAAHSSTGETITGLTPTWDGSTLSITSAKNLAAGVTDTYTVLINATITTLAPSMRQCQGGEPGHGFLNTGAATSGQNTSTARACIAISPPVPTTTPTPTPTAPTPATTAPPPSIASTGFAAARFLTTAVGLLIVGTLLLLASRRRARNRPN
jgi:fimbrial isopeptide formation D2 family protein